MALLLHDFELDEHCYKVRLLIGALGLACQKVVVNMVPGAEQTRPPLLDKNPLGTLPILEDGDGPDGVVMRDAEAILVYLATRYDPTGAWWPDDPAARGDTVSWLLFAARDLEAAALARRHAMFEAPVDRPAVVARARRCFRLMDDHMTARRLVGCEWFVGARASLADIALFPSFALSRDFGVEHESYPALRRWARRVRTIPGFTTMPGIRTTIEAVDAIAEGRASGNCLEPSRRPTPALRHQPEHTSLAGICATLMMSGPLTTPDGRYIVVRGRLWRRANPHLPEAERQRLVAVLMDARRHVGAARRQGGNEAAAHAAVDAAKIALGERGPVWWSDGAPDLTRHMARTTSYADWFSAQDMA